MQYQEEFISIVKELGQQYGTGRVFEDFVSMASIELSQTARVSVGLPKDGKEEEKYLRIVKQYKPTEIQEQFIALLKNTILGLEKENPDFLGHVFSVLELGNTSLGQFFTPWHICQLMAEISLDNEKIKSDVGTVGFTSICEPCCGSGAMIVAFADVFRKSGHDVSTQMFALAQDISPVCAAMCHIQLSLFGIPAVVETTNVLLKDEPLWSRRTPMFYWMGWNHRLRRIEQEVHH